MQLREWLQRGEAQLLAGPHPERARRDAEVLLLRHIGKDRAWLMAHAQDEYAGCGAIGYATLLDRRSKGEPIQYILGEAEFYGLPFRLTSDVLIPRPETEHLVEKVVELSGAFREPRIADVGTGSGAIATAIAHAAPNAQVTAIDLSNAALALARGNAERNGVADRIRFLQGDLLAPVADEQFDILASNPPYVPSADRDTLAVEVRNYEPDLALFAGEDGLAVYRRLIPAAFAVLPSGGLIALEIGYGQAAALRILLAAAGFEHIEFSEDLQEIPRVVTAQHP